MSGMDADDKIGDLARRVDLLASAMERAGLAEYVELVRHPWRMACINFLSGIARGLGTAVGFTILGALLVYLLQHYMLRNLPWVGSRLADLIQITQIYMRARP